MIGAEWHNRESGWAGSTHVGIELVGVSRQRRLAELDLPTAGYSLINVSAGFDRVLLGRSLAVDLAVHNLANTAYRDFLSRYKAFALNPGRDIMVRVATTL